MLLTIAIFVAVLGALIFVHELGHFLVAKRSGIVVEEFAFGYPPRLLTVWQEEGRIVLDGKPLIMSKRVDVSRKVEVGKRVVYRSETRADGQEVLTHIEAIPNDMGDEQVVSKYGRPASQVNQLQRGTRYAINLIPFGGYVRMLGEEDPSHPGSFASKSKKVRVAVLVAGAAMNLVFAMFVFAAAFMMGEPQAQDFDNVMVMGVSNGSPAAQADLRVGDVILSINNVRVQSPEQLITLTNRWLGREVRLKVQRGDQTLEVRLVPRPDPPSGEGPMGVTIQPAVSRATKVYHPLPEALLLGARQTIGIIELTLRVPIMALRGEISGDIVRPSGPLGIYQQTESTVREGQQQGWWFPLFFLTGAISTALAITNLLPLPALDGGRIMFIVIEAIRGRRVDPAREGLVHFVGLAVLLMLMLVVSYFDYTRPLPQMNWSGLFR